MKCFLLTSVFLLFIHSSGLACTCLPAKNATEEIGRSAAVFSGKVIEIRRDEGAKDLFATVEAVFEVERAWKGIEKKTVSVFTSSQSSACGYGFKRGESYLVYASEGREGRLITSICSRTRLLKDANDDLKELGEGKEISGD
ncbi:MAG TPA: hypothetical protein VNO14_03480 [Blastocatellia bacterium]|nr:hypothetical protein [Blastocatellia bacterium]